MKKHTLLNVYENGWSIQCGIFGIWKVFKEGQCFGRFGTYEDAEKALRELQEAER